MCITRVFFYAKVKEPEEEQRLKTLLIDKVPKDLKNKKRIGGD